MEWMYWTLIVLFPKKNGKSLGDNCNTSGIRGQEGQESQQQVEGGGKAMEKPPACRQDLSKPSNKHCPS